MCHNSTQPSVENDANYWSSIVGISALEVYKKDIRVKYMKYPSKPPEGRQKEDKVKMFTKKSRQRLAFVASNTSVTFTWMTTLTYPKEFTKDGKEVKKHMNAFLTWMRRTNKGVQYLWFLEFQKRGAPHFHVLTNARMRPVKVSERWYKIVGSGDIKHLRAGTRTEQLRSQEGGARYVVKYAQKMKQKEVPKNYENVGRFWGHSAGVKPEVLYVYDSNPITRDELVELFGFWEYQPALISSPMSTMYNTSGHYPQIKEALKRRDCVQE